MTRRKNNVLAHSVGAGTHRLRRFARFPVGMYTHLRKVLPKVRFHRCARAGIERFPRRTQNVVYHIWGRSWFHCSYRIPL
jgi:hypothetical protein